LNNIILNYYQPIDIQTIKERSKGNLLEWCIGRAFYVQDGDRIEYINKKKYCKEIAKLEALYLISQTPNLQNQLQQCKSKYGQLSYRIGCAYKVSLQDGSTYYLSKKECKKQQMKNAMKNRN